MNRHRLDVRISLCLLGLILFLTGTVHGQENRERAARSVHLGYAAPPAEIFYNEVTVRETYPGSYFMVCGFRHGYFGIQDLGGGRKVVLFSVWDPAGTDTRGRGNPNDVKQEDRVKVLYAGEGVQISRFGRFIKIV